MNLIIFLVALIASFIVVRIGAVAFQLTGLEWALAKSGLRAKDITVLVVRRDSEPIANPHADTRIQIGDQLLCFGKLDQMRKEFAGDESQCPERAR